MVDVFAYRNMRWPKISNINISNHFVAVDLKLEIWLEKSYRLSSVNLNSDDIEVACNTLTIILSSRRSKKAIILPLELEAIEIRTTW